MKPAARWIAWIVALGCSAAAFGQQPVVTVVADFENDAVATSIGQVEGVLRADCATRLGSLPARGSYCLAVDIGATQPSVTAVADMLLRNPARFDSLDELGGFVWITAAPVKVAFRVQDADGREFEAPETTIKDLTRWAPLKVRFDPASLKALAGQGPPRMPIQIHGVRITTTERGKQTIHLDDLQVAHRVSAVEALDGQFSFNEPTRIYDPGATAGAKVILENRSLEKALSVTVNLSWIQPDGATLKEQTGTVDLPNASSSLRSYQTIDFSQKLPAPGLYRVVAKARAAGWTAAKTFETTIAVTPSNRNLPRGRGQRFGMRSNLWREPRTDQRLELALARDIGVQVLMLDVPWDALEPRDDDFRLDALEELIKSTSDAGMTPAVALVGKPGWMSSGSDEAQYKAVLNALARKFGRRVPFYAVAPAPGVAADAPFRELTERVAKELRAVAPIELIADGFAWPDGAELPAPLVAPSDNTGLLVASRAHSAAGRFAPPPTSARWSRNHIWNYAAPSLIIAGGPLDAVNTLRSYVAASKAGVRGLWWFDLRDDDNEPSLPDGWHGLSRRDFSPKTPLLGYASAAGMLSDLTYSGELFEAPPEFETALFIGSDRQVGVIVPRPNRILPAVIAPLKGVPGEWDVRSFDRSPRKLLSGGDRPLARVSGEPLYLTLRPSSAQPKPQVGCATPWLRAPQAVFANVPTPIEIDAAGPVRKGFYQLSPARDAAYKLNKSAGSLNGAAAQTTTIELTAALPADTAPGGPFTLKASLDDVSVEFPIEVRTLEKVPTKGFEKLASLRPASGRRAAPGGAVFAMYDAGSLQLKIEIEDEKFVSAPATPRANQRWDELRVGVALEGQDAHAEWTIAETPENASIATICGDGAAPAELARTVDGAARTYVLKIAPGALGADGWRVGQRVLLCVRYVDEDNDGYPPSVLSWGVGLEGDCSTADFAWAALIE